MPVFLDSVRLERSHDTRVCSVFCLPIQNRTRHEARGASPLDVAAQLASNRWRAYLPSVLPRVLSCKSARLLLHKNSTSLLLCDITPRCYMKTRLLCSTRSHNLPQKAYNASLHCGCYKNCYISCSTCRVVCCIVIPQNLSINEILTPKRPNVLKHSPHTQHE